MLHRIGSPPAHAIRPLRQTRKTVTGPLRVARVLSGRPLSTALVYVLIGILPLYLTSSQLLSLQEELGFSAARLGFATALHFGLAALAARPIGGLVARVGAQTGLRIGSLLAVAASVIAVATQTWWLLLAVTSLGGLANGFMQVSTNVYLATDAAFHRQGISFGAKQGAIPLGNAMAGFLLPVVGVTLGWRWPYAIAAGMAGLSIVVAPRLLNPPAESVSAEGRSKIKVSTALRWLAVGGFCGGAAGNSLALFVVPSAVDVGVNEAAAGVFLAWSAGAVFAIRVGAGWLADRTRSSGHREMTALLALGAVAGVVLSSTSSSAVYLVAMALTLIGAWGWPGLVYFTVVRIHPEAPARASAVILAGNLTGTMLGPMAVGVLADRGEFGAAWMLCAVLSAVAAAAMARSRVLHRARSVAMVAGEGS
jgi:MFS family permease